jgi:hypothetical protein
MTGCGSSTSPTASTPASTAPTSILDMHSIVHSIEASIWTQRHIRARVTCPPVILQQKGRDFACIARVAHSTSRTPVTVTQQNNDGYVTYRVE